MASIAKNPCELTLRSVIECVGRLKITMQIHTRHLEGISEKFKLRANLNIKKTFITLRLYRAGENSLTTNVVNRKKGGK